MQFFQNGKPSEKRGLLGPRDKFAEYDSRLGTEIDLESGLTRSNQENAVEGSVLSAHNIDCTVQVSTGCCRRKETKQILHNVTGVYKKGLNAILGPTGSGKTTLLDVLADRKDPREVEGHRLLDAKPVPDNFKCMVGYVVQGDILMGTLTVRENLAFSAALRLPTTMSHCEKQERVDKVIKELGLQECSDRKVGTPLIRGVSGGEKKRCSIGVELIISPSILLLDEPTTGLDANTACTVLLTLKRMAGDGRTIILSIHQPRYAIYQLFDSITLLAGGRTVYFGPAQEAMHFFAEQGLQCQAYNNPPDFFLDVINRINAQTSEFEGMARTSEELIQHFKGSRWHNRLEAEADAILSKYICRGKQLGDRHPTVAYATSWSHQMMVVCQVTAQDTIRNPEAAALTLIKNTLVSLLLAIVFWQLSEDPSTAFRDRFGGMFFVSLHLVYFNVTAVNLFIKERKRFLHESITGYYRVSVYFLAKLCSDVVPIRFASTFSCCVIVYYCMDLRDGFANSCLFLLCMFAMCMAGASLALLIGTWITDFSVCLPIMMMIVIQMTLFCGIYVHVNSVNIVIRWLKHVSLFRYGVKALCIVEFKDRLFCGPDKTCEEGNTFLADNDIPYETAWNLWSNYVYLFGFTALMLILTYIRLRCMSKYT